MVFIEMSCGKNYILVAILVCFLDGEAVGFQIVLNIVTRCECVLADTLVLFVCKTAVIESCCVGTIFPVPLGLAETEPDLISGLDKSEVAAY